LNGRPGGSGGNGVNYQQKSITIPELYDLNADPGQSNDLASANPDVVKRLLVHAERARVDLGDDQTKRKGSGRRSVGKIQGESVFPNQFPKLEKVPHSEGS
jgi:hypothetical protein